MHCLLSGNQAQAQDQATAIRGHFLDHRTLGDFGADITKGFQGAGLPVSDLSLLDFCWLPSSGLALGGRSHFGRGVCKGSVLTPCRNTTDYGIGYYADPKKDQNAHKDDQKFQASMLFFHSDVNYFLR